MRRIISFVLALTFTFLFIIPVSAADENIMQLSSENSSRITYYDDGSYTITTIEFIEQPSNVRSVSRTIEGKKIIDFYDSSDELVWTYTLIGHFNVVIGESSSCFYSTYSYTIYDSKWSLTAHNNYCSDNVAYGTATFKKKVLLITTNTYNIDAKLTCDVNGNFS